MLRNRSVTDIQSKRKNREQRILENDVKHLVFLDESGINTDMTRRYARVKKNQRAVDSMPLNTPATTTILCSIYLNGSCICPTYQGGTTAEQFESYLKSDLLPTLGPDDIVVMDNIRSHHANVVKNLSDEKHIQYLYLPPYSWTIIRLKICGQKSKPIWESKKYVPQLYYPKLSRKRFLPFTYRIVLDGFLCVDMCDNLLDCYRYGDSLLFSNGVSPKEGWWP